MVVCVTLGGPRGGPDARGLRWAALLVLIGALVVSPAAADEGSGGSSGTVSTQVTVANALPETIHWDVAHERFLGFYTFNVSAWDNNGVDDLDRLVLLLVDANGVETRHEADEGERLNATTATWRGQVWAEKRPIATPVQVEIEVQDRAGDVTVDQGQGRPLVAWPGQDPGNARTGTGPAWSGESATSDRSASSAGKAPNSVLGPLYSSAAQIQKGLFGVKADPGSGLPALFWGLLIGVVSALLLVVGRRPYKLRRRKEAGSSDAPSTDRY